MLKAFSLLILSLSLAAAQAELIGRVNAIAFAGNGDAYVAGRFHSDDGVYTNLVRLKRDTMEIDRSFKPIKVISVQSGPFLAGIESIATLPDGDIVAVMGNGTAEDRQFTARFSPNGEIRTNFITVAAGGTVDVHPFGGIIRAGSFVSSDNEMARAPGLRQFLEDGRLDGEQTARTWHFDRAGQFWQSHPLLGPRFVISDGNGENARTNLAVRIVRAGPDRMLFLPDASIIVSGSTMRLEDSSGTDYTSPTRLLPDGRIDTTFLANSAAPVNSMLEVINALELQPDGKILVGGTFTTFGGQSAGRIVRLNPDGSRDETFPANPGADFNVNVIAVSPQGETWVGGGFTNFNGMRSPGVIKLPMDLSATKEEIGFQWTRMGVDEGGSPLRLEVFRQGDGDGEVRATVALDDGRSIAVQFSNGDVARRIIEIEFAADGSVVDRAVAATFENVLGATVVPAAGRCEILVRDNQSGVQVEYWDLPPGAATGANGPSNFTTNLFGKKVYTARDSVIRAHWSVFKPAAALATNQYAIVWRGQFVPERTGPHTFGAAADDGVRIWVNGELLPNRWMMQNVSVTNFGPTLTLTAGKAVPIEVHFANTFSIGAMELLLKEQPLRRRHFRLPAANQGIAPQILWPGTTYNRAAGDGVTFAPEILGTPPLNVQWSSGSGPIAGANEFTLSLTNLTFERARDYSVVASNAWGTASGVARLNIFPTPKLTITNADAPVVTVEAAPEIRYWLEASADFKRWSELTDYPTNGVQRVYPNKATWFEGMRSFFRIRYDSAP